MAKSGAKVRKIAYAGGRLTWRGVKAAASFVRSGLGLGMRFASQIFTMVAYYLAFSTVVNIAQPVINKKIVQPAVNRIL